MFYGLLMVAWRIFLVVRNKINTSSWWYYEKYQKKQKSKDLFGITSVLLWRAIFRLMFISTTDTIHIQSDFTKDDIVIAWRG